MVRLKGCPRCKGDLIASQNRDGWTEQCLQCGYERDIANNMTANTENKILAESTINKVYPGKDINCL